jgi:monothiol glutaredoxin
LIGGCDIVMEMYESGELASALGVEGVQPASAPAQAASAPAQAASTGGFMQIENRLG